MGNNASTNNIDPAVETSTFEPGESEIDLYGDDPLYSVDESDPASSEDLYCSPEDSPIDFSETYDASQVLGSEVQLFGFPESVIGVIEYRLANVSAGELPSEAEFMDPNKDGWLTEDEFAENCGMFYGSTEGWDPRTCVSYGFDFFRKLMLIVEENPEQAELSLERDHLLEPYASEGSEPISDPSRSAFYEEANKIYQKVHTTPNMPYGAAKRKLLRAAKMYSDLGHKFQADACYRLLAARANEYEFNDVWLTDGLAEGYVVYTQRQQDAAFALAQSALIHGKFDKAFSYIEELPPDYPGRHSLQQSFADSVRGKSLETAEVSRYLVRAPEGRYTFTEEFNVLPPRERARLLAELTDVLIPETDGVEGFMTSAMEEMWVDMVEYLKFKIEQSEGLERSYYETKLHLVQGDYREAIQVYEDLLEEVRLAGNEELETRILADLKEARGVHDVLKAQELIKLDLFMNEREVRGEAPDSRQRQIADQRSAFMMQMLELLQTGQAANIKEAVEQAQEIDPEGYEAWAQWSAEIYHYSYMSTAYPELGAPGVDPTVPHYDDVVDAAEKIGDGNIDEVWHQRAEYMLKQCDYEGLRYVLEEFLAEPYEEALNEHTFEEEVDEKYGSTYKRELERHFAYNADTFRELIVAEYLKMGIEVTKDDPQVTEDLDRLIREQVDSIIEDKKSFERHRLAFKHLELSTEQERWAAGMYEFLFDPLDKWHQPTKENFDRFMTEAAINVPLILVSGFAASGVRTGVVGGLRGAVLRYGGKAALETRAVRAGIYTTGMFAAGYTFHTAQSIMLTPFIGMEAWKDYWGHGLKASFMFGILDAAKLGFHFAANASIKGGSQLFSVEAKVVMEHSFTRGALWTGELVVEANALTAYGKLIYMAEAGMPTDETYLESTAHNLLLVLELRAGGAVAKRVAKGVFELGKFDPVIEPLRPVKVNDVPTLELSEPQKVRLSEVESEFTREVEILRGSKDTIRANEVGATVYDIYQRTLMRLAKIVIPEGDYEQMALVMFGSAARQEVNWDSDCDFLFVVPRDADIPRFQEYMVTIFDAAAEIGFKMDGHLMVLSLETADMVPAPWNPRRSIARSVRDSLVSPGQLTSLRFVGGKKALYEGLMSDVVEPLVSDPDFMAFKYEKHVIRNGIGESVQTAALTKENVNIPLKDGAQRLVNAILWMTNSRYGTDLKNSQEALDYLLRKGVISEREHRDVARLLRMVIFLRLFGQYDDSVESEWTNREALEELAYDYSDGELSPARAKEFREIFNIPEGKEITDQYLLEELLRCVYTAKTVADKVRPLSYRVKEGAIEKMPRWSQEQLVRLRVWHLKQKAAELDAEITRLGNEGELTVAEVRVCRKNLEFLVKDAEEVLTAVQEGRSLSPQATRRLLLHGATLIDSLTVADLLYADSLTVGTGRDYDIRAMFKTQ